MCVTKNVMVQIFQLQGVESWDLWRQHTKFAIAAILNFISIHSPSIYKLSMIRFVHFDFGLANEYVLSLYLSPAYTSFRYSESMASPIAAREIDGLPKASMVELLVTKQDPNSCDRVG